MMFRQDFKQNVSPKADEIRKKEARKEALEAQFAYLEFRFKYIKLPLSFKKVNEFPLFLVFLLMPLHKFPIL